MTNPDECLAAVLSQGCSRQNSLNGRFSDDKLAVQARSASEGK